MKKFWHLEYQQIHHETYFMIYVTILISLCVINIFLYKLKTSFICHTFYANCYISPLKCLIVHTEVSGICCNATCNVLSQLSCVNRKLFWVRYFQTSQLTLVVQIKDLALLERIHCFVKTHWPGWSRTLKIVNKHSCVIHMVLIMNISCLIVLLIYT
jgi:hypothetical protein